MHNFTNRLWLMTTLLLCISTIGIAQQTTITTSSVKGRLVRVTPPLDQLDRNTMYGDPLKITRRGTGFAKPIIDPEEAEERVFRYRANPDKPYDYEANTVITPDVPATALNLNIDGQVASGFAPSDNNLAVGPNHVVQMINHSSGSYLKVWNKAGTVVKASTVLSTITGVTGAGDPVVVYDQLADRWLLSEFGYSGGVTNYINTLIIAISKTSDPAGQYYIYSFNIGSFFVDYPKYAVWHNGYYATSNDFNTAGTSYLGSSAYAFDRNAMLSGAATATMIRTRFTGSGNRYYSMAPVCQEGPTTSNQSGMFALIHDNGWGGATTDSILLFEYTPNYAAGTAVAGPFRGMAATRPFNTNTGNVSQLGTTTTVQTLNQRLMHKVIYRNFGTHESIVCNTVDLQNSRTGVHWWELRRPGSGNWSIYQEGLYQPSGDSHSRFMASIAINADGNIGLVYNVSSSSMYPAIRYTGRNSCDPLGQMTLPEASIKESTTFNGTSRYGDYNTLTVDPSNGSFWGTAQYNASGYGTYGNWVTRVFNFSLTGGCANAGTVSGTSPLCVGQSATYTSSGDPGGTWSSSNTSVATVNASTGSVTAIAAGSTNITYTVSGSSAFKTLVVNAAPNAGTISGPSSVCVSGTASLSTNGDAGGTWSSDNSSVATVNATTGVVTGVTNGTANITYSVSTSCGNSTSAAYAITVSTCATPTVNCPANISAAATAGCSVSVTTPDPSVSNASTVTWSMSGATTATSGSSGINYVGTYSFNIGTTTITYTASNGSQSSTCSFTVNVTDNTAAAISCPADQSKSVSGRNCFTSVSTPNPNISGNCSVSTLTWVMSGATSGNSVATGINYVGAQNFNVGITTVTYTVTNGAGNTATCNFTVTVRNKKCPNSPAEPEGEPGNNNVLKTNGVLQVNVMPNPAETYFTLRLVSGTTEDVTINIFTVNGKLIEKLNGSAYQNYRFGNNYGRGVYIAVVRQGDKTTTVRLVK